MRPEMRRRLLWQLFGLVCYLAGIGLFLGAFVVVYFGPPTHSLANFGTSHGVAMFTAVTLLVVGKGISVRYGGLDVAAGDLSGFVFEDRPEPTALEQLGYRIEPEEDEASRQEYAYDEGDVLVVCPECGARNEPSYRFCAACSSELPEPD